MTTDESLTMNLFDMPLGNVSGLAGDVVVLSVSPQMNFRVEKVMATDSEGGTATRVRQFIVGQRLQRPANNNSTLLAFFGPAVLGNGLTWDTCQRGCQISATIEFVRASSVDITLFGRAV